jgi:hypothetical protein
MLYDPEFSRALAQARIARLIAEADAARAAREARAARGAWAPETRHSPTGWVRRFAVNARRNVAGWLRSRRRTAIPVPRPRLSEESPQ